MISIIKITAHGINRTRVISSESSKQISAKRIKKLFDGIRKETGVIFTNFLVSPDNAFNKYCSFSAEWFT